MKANKLEQIINRESYDLFPEELVTIPRYQHIERLGHTEVKGILDGTIHIQTKIDGANLTVWCDKELGVIVASRNRVQSLAGVPSTGFNGAIQYVYNHPGIIKLTKKYILRGEWLTKHTIRYPKEFMNKFYVFDVQEYDTFNYVPYDVYKDELISNGIDFIKISHVLDHPTPEELIPLMEGPDEFGIKQKEGIVIKNYNFVNQYNRIKWAKLVSKEFKEKNKIVFGGGKRESKELRFVAETVSRHIVLKTIHKIIEVNGSTSIKDMRQVLGRVWYDVFNEELWEFVKKHKVKDFNFGIAQIYVTRKTREIALDYYNGLIPDDVQERILKINA